LKIKAIFDAAINIINKKSGDEEYDEYMERATYILANFCCANAAIDRDFRETHGLPSQESFNEIVLDMDDDFPFDSRFSAPAAHYLAAILMLDENGDVSENIFDAYADNMSKVKNELPMKKGKIFNVYP